MSNNKTEWYFIVNPRAGSGRTMSQWVPAERRLCSLGVEYQTVLTDHRRHATILAYEAAARGFRRIAAVGGDGSVHEVFCGVCRYCSESGTPFAEFTLAVVPIGSGNDLIRSLGIPRDTLKAIDCIARGATAASDVVKVSFAGKVAYMANVGGTGFDSHVCQRVNYQKESGLRSKSIYLRSLIYTVMHIRPINLKLVADGQTVYDGSCYSIALGCGRYSGGGMRQVPEAVMDDGLLDYTIVPVISLPLILCQLPLLFSGKLLKSPYVKAGKCRELQIIPMDKASEDVVEIDGEIEGSLPLRVEVCGSGIKYIIS